MPIYLAAENVLNVGSALVVQAPALEGPYSVVFEDDEETAYLYALDESDTENPIQDALHIYDVEDVSDRDRPSTIRIGWSQDHRKAVLLINDYPHAVFDFAGKQGYCRSGFPPSLGKGWSGGGHDWDDNALKLFA